MAASNKSHVKRWVIGGLIAVFAVVLTAAFPPSRSPDAKQSSCQVRDSDAHPIPFKRLSDEKSFPFLKFGHPPSYRLGKKRYENAQKYYGYLSEIATHFPDVRSCLMESEMEKQIPNLNSFDWNKIRSQDKAEVCLFRIFSSIGSVEGSEQWLKNQGFNVYESFNFINEGKTSIVISASWDIKACGDRFKRSNIALFDPFMQFVRLGEHHMSVGAIFSGDSEVKNTSVSFQWK